jgi:uncharacterized protein YndB with AHSA1/START domain
MSSSGKLDLTTPSDREVALTRRFEAPPHLVWEAFTRPDLVKRWMYGLEDWRLQVCSLDLRPGGTLRYEWHGPDGAIMGLSGAFKEVDPPHRMVHTELFDEDWTGGETVITTTFAPEGPDATVVTMTIRYASPEARDGALKTGMAEGMEMSYARLDGLLAEGAVAG